MAPQQRNSPTMVIVDNSEYSSSSYSPTQQTIHLDSKKLMTMKTNDTYGMRGNRTSIPPSPATKKRTRFALSNNEVFPIPHINDMSDEEVKGVWYEKTDYDQIKADIIPIVKRIMKGDKIEETNEMTIRGLEYRTRKGAIKRQHNKVEAITAVLDEQDRQIELDINDPELISQAYLEIAANCLLEAQHLAQGDIIPALEYLNEQPSRSGADDCSMYSSDTESCTSSVRSGRGGVERKTSFTKMFKQMRIRRSTSISRKDGPEAA